MSKNTLEKIREKINTAYRSDETLCVNHLIEASQITQTLSQEISATATTLVNAVRARKQNDLDLAAFLQVYQLNSQEGIALLCLAEALLRVPDKNNIDALIQDKISQFSQHDSTTSQPFFINATTWALLLTGKVTRLHQQKSSKLGGVLRRLVQRSGMPMIRSAVKQAMKILGKQFILGRTIDEALTYAKKQHAQGHTQSISNCDEAQPQVSSGVYKDIHEQRDKAATKSQLERRRVYRYSYDMLGEAACTEDDAKRYLDAYLQAIHAIGKTSKHCPIISDGISVKLSALHPRYEFSQYDKVLPILVERVKKLALVAKQYNIGLTIDAEEADSLDFSLDIIQQVFTDPALSDWHGFGLALQAYQKRAWYVIDWLAELAKQQQKKIMLRLIKGAYWDSEIKHSQVDGHVGYPVFTRKASTDISYLACAKKIIDHSDCFFPQFATHNAHSVAAILHLVGDRRDVEFQCLHGMGQALYDYLLQQPNAIACRIYAPVGSHQELLPYLVRRLLENGANTSFVHRITDSTVPVSALVVDPIQQIRQSDPITHPLIPLPMNLYSDRRNSPGVDLSDRVVAKQVCQAIQTHSKHNIIATPLIAEKPTSTDQVAIASPQNTSHMIGQCIQANQTDIQQAISTALTAKTHWQHTDVNRRADCLLSMADLLEKKRDELFSLLVTEAGKTLLDAINEWREAIDFCRYYARQALTLCAQPTTLPGPTGESNQLHLYGRGIIVCISPWNFPLAIFLGQVAAALVTGNVVLAKPAEQTPLIAYVATQLFHQAGIPRDVLQLLPGTGEVVGAQLVSSDHIDGVMFTGSTQTARYINQTLAQRQGAIIPFIAETGGQNVMLVDSTALPEQVVKDVVQSAFASSGQRCSALRVLYLQQDIADRVIELLKGAMAELVIGDPALLNTDIGPVIDKQALTQLQTHQQCLSQQAKLHYQATLSQNILRQGHFFAPTLFEIDSLSQLTHEVFGPCLHIIRYHIDDLEQVLTDIQQTGYGLTMGIHSRIEHRAQMICEKMRIGNIYVNRNMIGAVVGVQPFGGEGLSGTGPKAGGPHYLSRLCCERTVSIDTTAAGGNASLMSLDDHNDFNDQT